MFAIAWPIILANAAVPLLGLADTAVIGNTGSITDLGAIALGALLFNFLYWGFGFLRMGTTGFTAQADGAGDEAEVRATLGRALLLAGAIGALLIVVHRPLIDLALFPFGASDEVKALTRDYFLIRIWGAPAALAVFALMGTLIGLGRSGLLLKLQLFLNGLNIALDVLFAGVFGWGVQGIAFGTALAEWSTCLLALFLVVRMLRRRQHDLEPFWSRPRILDAAKLRRTLGANADIMIRTLALLFAFAWFTHQGARFGDQVLAANHILLQFVAFSAYFLDGYAFAAEVVVGRAIGARRLDVFDAAVHRSSELAAATAVALALALLLFGDLAIHALTNLEAARQTAARYLPWACAYVLLSFAAFQLDGIFIGATRTRDMRNASLASLALFLLAWWPLANFGNDGLWIAFIAYVLARALALAWYYPGLRRAVSRRGVPEAG
ncbi:MAG TPA: MATE family efflux transporter [Xanthomonadaceae bacterium]|nr:MATE family efflux transporter [Xanthomonadaceae bacterium]